MRCLCNIEPKYWDKKNRCANPCVNDYIRECSARARQVQAEAEAIDDPDEKRDHLASGLPNLLDLRNLYTGNLQDFRYIISNELPFKLRTCFTPYVCCGSCMRECSSRCVQDLLQRIYFICNGAYVGYEATKEQHLTLKAFLDPQVTYECLLDIVNAHISRRRNERIGKALEEGDIDENPNIYDYGPIIKGRYTESGRFVKSYDPDTLLYDIIQWPESGLCPYCMPESVARAGKSGRKSKRNLFENQLRR